MRLLMDVSAVRLMTNLPNDLMQVVTGSEPINELV